MMVRLIAIERSNVHEIGDEYDEPEPIATLLVDRGKAKRAEVQTRQMTADDKPAAESPPALKRPRGRPRKAGVYLRGDMRPEK
jgi:hypothetical protein